MENLGMKNNKIKKIKLSPFVHMVKGLKNYALYDLSQQRLFNVTSDGDVEDLKKQLLEADLAIETDGVIPFKYEKNLDMYKDNIMLRELQIRITGRCDMDCQECGRICECFKGGGDMPDAVLNKVLLKFKNIPIERVLVTGGNPFMRINVAQKIRDDIIASKYTFFYKGKIDISEKVELTRLGYENISIPYFCNEINKENLQSDSFAYFYSQKYNICWGHKIAIDTDGSIKVCLWSEKALGNILQDNVKKMIIKGVFDEYWNLEKNKIDICNQCEYRYGCPDCRVQALKETDCLTGKTSFCKYDPRSVTWNK
jgi:radical SAM protein with 4Fe4S-binding SPASM domain